MFVKIFQASGLREIEALEDKINEWSADQTKIKHVDTALCQIGTAEYGERYQHYVVSVWYS